MGDSQANLAASYQKSIERAQGLAMRLDNLAAEMRSAATQALTLSNNLDRCKGAKFVIYCSRCKHYTSTLADGGHCLLSGLEVEKKTFAQKLRLGAIAFAGIVLTAPAVALGAETLSLYPLTAGTLSPLS